MPVTANQVENYQGNASLASGGIGGGGVIDTTEANKYVNQVAYLNLQKNKDIHDQKIKDRDETMKLIQNGEMAVNNALPQDRERIQGMIGQAKELWLTKHGDLKSDPNDWIEFNDQLSKVKEASTLAQSRLNDYKTGMTEAAKETNPYIKKKMMEHYEEEKNKSLYEPFMPYQQTLDWDRAKVHIAIPTSEEVISTDANGYKTTRKKFDLDKGYRDFQGRYVNGDKDDNALNVDKFLESYYGQDGIMQPGAVNAQVKNVNDTLDKIAVEHGFDLTKPETIPDYLKHVATTTLNGQVHSGGQKWDDWYKIELANQYDNSTTTSYDKNVLEAKKTNAEIAKIGSEIGLNNKKGGEAAAHANLYYEKAAKLSEPKQQTELQMQGVFKSIIDNTNFDSLTANKNTYTYQTDPKTGKKTKVLTSSRQVGDPRHSLPARYLPAGYQFINGVGPDGHAIQLKPFMDSNNQPYFVPEFTDIHTGNKMDIRRSKNKDLDAWYQKAVADYAKSKKWTLRQAENNYTYDNYLKTLAANGQLGFRLLGANNSAADYNSMVQSLTATNNHAAGKVQVFGDDDGPSDDQSAK